MQAEQALQNLLLGRGSGEVKAASTGGDNPVGQLIYTATADDSSNDVWAKDEVKVDGIPLSIEDRKHTQCRKLKRGSNNLSFTVLLTDSAGNSSEWPISVSLSVRERTGEIEQADSQASEAEPSAP